MRPAYLSKEFFNLYFPNASQRTRDVYAVYLSRFNPENDDVVQWVEDSNSLAEVQEKLRLASIIRDYIPNYAQNDKAIQEMRIIMRRKRGQGANFTQQSEETKIQNSTDTLKMIGTGELNAWSLFGRWLPPRRREIAEFEITKMPEEGKNQYSQLTKKFYFYNFKNDKNKSTQVYTWDDLSFIPQSQLDNARNFLDNLPAGNLYNKKYTPNHYGETYKDVNGYTIGQYRHAWAWLGRTKFTRENYLKFLQWMDHGLGVSIRTYSI